MVSKPIRKNFIFHMPIRRQTNKNPGIYYKSKQRGSMISCQIVWMCHSRSFNNKVHHIHERTLRIIYQYFQSSFSAWFVKDNSFTIHQKSLQLLATESFKVKMNISPQIMNEIFDFSKNHAYGLRCGNCLSRLRILGVSPLQILLLKYGIKHLVKSKKYAPLEFLKVKSKNGFQRVALLDFAKYIWDKWVLCN